MVLLGLLGTVEGIEFWGVGQKGELVHLVHGFLHLRHGNGGAWNDGAGSLPQPATGRCRVVDGGLGVSGRGEHGWPGVLAGRGGRESAVLAA